jgi:hypothetical protein
MPRAEELKFLGNSAEGVSELKKCLPVVPWGPSAASANRTRFNLIDHYYSLPLDE